MQLLLPNFLPQPSEVPEVFRLSESLGQFHKAYKNWKWYFLKTLRAVFVTAGFHSNTVSGWSEILHFLPDIHLRSNQFFPACLVLKNPQPVCGSLHLFLMVKFKKIRRIQ